MKHIFIILFVIGTAITSYSQNMTIAQIEKDLHQTYNKIVTFRYNADTISWDSLEIVNEILNAICIVN